MHSTQVCFLLTILLSKSPLLVSCLPQSNPSTDSANTPSSAATQGIVPDIAVCYSNKSSPTTSRYFSDGPPPNAKPLNRDACIDLIDVQLPRLMKLNEDGYWDPKQQYRWDLGTNFPNWKPGSCVLELKVLPQATVRQGNDWSEDAIGGNAAGTTEVVKAKASDFLPFVKLDVFNTCLPTGINGEPNDNLGGQAAVRQGPFIGWYVKLTTIA